ncbi:hypothetical protein B0H67DRAFT_495506, partial [Lasiosphaeris hirsuta]
MTTQCTCPPPIVILYPDYPPSENMMLYLRAIDGGGIDYDTALTACSIILPDADVPDRPYTVVLRFQDWEFPHQSLPLPWKDLRLTVAGVGESCRMTDSLWALEKAHLVPLAAEEWWNREGLSRYLSLDLYSQKTINASKNSIRFRQDMHTVFDKKAFAMVPK